MNASWASWRLKLLETRLFIQQLVQANNKEGEYLDEWWIPLTKGQ